MSLLFEDEEQIGKLREALIENFPPEKTSGKNVIDNIEPKKPRFIKGPAILYAMAVMLLALSLGFHAAGKFPIGSMLHSYGLAIAVGTVVGNTSLNRYLTRLNAERKREKSKRLPCAVQSDIPGEPE